MALGGDLDNPSVSSDEASGAKRIACEIVSFGTEGTEPTGSKHDAGTTPAAPTSGDGTPIPCNIPFIELASLDQFVAKVTLPDNYTSGSQLFIRLVYGATVAASGTLTATLDAVSVVLDVSGNTVSANMATHENDASVSLVMVQASGHSDKIFENSALEVTNSSGVFDDESDSDVTADVGDVICTTIKRTDSDTESLRIYSVEMIWT